MSNYLERIGQDKIEDREEIEQLTARVRELETQLEANNPLLDEAANRIDELEEENARLKVLQQSSWQRGYAFGVNGLNEAVKGFCETRESYLDENERLTNALLEAEDRLAASQLRETQLREALELLNKVSNIGCGLVEKALALPHDTSALDAYVKPIEDSRDWYKRRIDLLQEWQSKMRDPERTIVCDIIANGLTMPEGGRYEIDTSDLSTLTRQRDLAVEALEKQGHSAGCRKNAFGDICTCGLDDLLSTIKESEAMAQGEKK